MLDRFINYYRSAHLMQQKKYEDAHDISNEEIGCDLILNVPIYDVVKRRFAAFSSLPEAVRYLEKDPKKNGIYFKKAKNINNKNFALMLYLFRLCGSGINYKPKENNLFGNSVKGTHGFGNFWVVEQLMNGVIDYDRWMESLPEKGFCDVKGYMLPLVKGGLRNFILDESYKLVMHILEANKKTIKEVVDTGNKYLIRKGFKRQTFVLTAFAMDLAEYFDVDHTSDVYIGSNAKKCLNLILPNKKHDYALRKLCELTKGVSNPMDMEDVTCDFIRYKESYQSKEHIKLNKGIKYEATF